MVELEVKSRMSGSARPSVAPEAPKAGAARQRYLGLGNLGESGPLLGRDGCDGSAGAMRSKLVRSDRAVGLRAADEKKTTPKAKSYWHKTSLRDPTELVNEIRASPVHFW